MGQFGDESDVVFHSHQDLSRVFCFECIGAFAYSCKGS